MDAVKHAPAPGIVSRHPELRWLLSAAVVVAVIATFTSYVSGAFRENDTGLSATGPEQVVSQVQATHTGGYAGTILAKVDLGLPKRLIRTLTGALPYGAALLSGSHTLRYWYGGQDKQRIAILQQSAEQDVFRNGRQLTLWNTATRTVERHALSSATAPLPLSAAPASVLTPPLLADMVLGTGASERTTTLRSGQTVAGRATYELVVQPTGSGSLIGSVHIQIDGKQAVPLQVQIYPRGSQTAAIDVSFTSISYVEPEQRNFSFAPPPSALTRTTTFLRADDIVAVGNGFQTTLLLPTSDAIAATIDRAMGRSMQRVKGRWGKGRLFAGGLLSLLVTSKGQVLAGPVTPRLLYGLAS